MDKHDRFIAINQTLPGLEDFLKVVLGSEPLSEEADRQRVEFLRRLESVSRPPSLPPRPANLSELYRARVQKQNDASHSGSVVPEESDLYKNERTLDPVEFASQQRELSRVANLYKTYAPQTVVLGEKGSKNGGLYFPRTENSNTTLSRDHIRDSIQSTASSTEDDIYEHLSLKGISPAQSVTPRDSDTDTRNEDTFVFPSPPKTPLEQTGTGIYVGTRPGSFRASGGKGKLSTGWFKREAKVYEEVYVSNLREPIIKGYLKDTKANKRRWCMLQGNRLHIFKTQDDPAIMIIDLIGCDIGVDDKKKISYSFRLTPKEGPGVSLAIEDGHDLSPWMSAIMAAVVRRGSIDRPTSPLESAYSLEQARAERIRGIEVDGGFEKEDDDLENIYELPVDHNTSGIPVAHSTPAPMESDDEDEGYDAPLPPLPIIDDYSSSESSSDEDESMDNKDPFEKAAAKKKIYDAIPADLLAELTGVKCSVVNNTNKSQDSICEEASTNEQSLDFTDSHSEHSGNISNRHSYSEALASDDTGSSEPKEEKSDSLSRKRTSTVLSISMDSVCSDTEDIRSRSLTSETSISSKRLGPKVKRRKLVPAEAELQFLQDPTAMHSGILYQKRRLGVWSKRYCKIVDSRFKSYRNPADQKPSLDFPILGYDISLMDSKDSKKSYCIKISHPSQETHYFATDSRVSIERWIEVLSLAATGRLDVITPYPPYFCAEQSGDELKNRSRESLLSSEGRLSDDEGANTLDELDAPTERDDSLKRLQTNEEQSSLPAVEGYTVLPNDARNVDFSSSVQTQTRPPEDEVQQPAEGGVKARVQKKRKGKPSDKDGTKTPSTMSPPHSMFISESVDGQAKPEPMNEEHPQSTVKDSTEDSSPKTGKRWTETLKKKKLARGLSYDYRLRGNVASSIIPENAKNKHLNMRRKSSQTFSHLLNLFDKEGRFCGYLTEVKYNKFGTTHLRRWCVVKNGVLIIYNSDSEESPQGKLSLVDMWLTDKSDESRNKFAFSLADKEGKETILQTTVKEDYQKWMGVLELFTELRVERPAAKVTDPLRKSDSGPGEEPEGSFERGTTIRSKSVRAANKLKDEIYALAPGKVRTSLRMKLSQRVNVRDIFRKTHSSYDLEEAANEGPSSALPDEIDTLAVFGGFLTEIEPNASVPNEGESRWCTIKEKELLLFSDRKATDPLQRIPLMGSVFSDLSDVENNVNRFQVRHGNENTVFDAWDKFDVNRWLRMLASVTEQRNSSDEERPKCVGRLTSPTFAKKKILHRRTRSEALQDDEEKPPTTARWYTKTKDGSTSSTDRLMSGYLQEVREAHGARTLLRRWCVATSEMFIVYDNQNSTKASFEWELSEMEVQDQSDMDAGSFGFCVRLGEEKLCFQVIDEDSARHWLSVLARYCHAVPANLPPFKPPSKWRSNSKEERRRSASDNDLKAVKNADKESDVLEVLSEGRASGRKLLRRATEDFTLFRKFNRSELFKAPWRASSEKLEVKMRERSGRAAANNAWKRYSCGSLFDSEGKYSGHLMELTTSELYSSQVRRWCLQKDDYLYVYDNDATERPIKIIPLFDAKVVNTSDLEACIYRFRIDYGGNKAVFFRALTRNDLEKWTTVISVKTAVLQDRSERQRRRSRTLSFEKTIDDITVSSESDVTSPDLHSAKYLTADDTSLHKSVSVSSVDSVFIRGISAEEETGTSGSPGLNLNDPVDESCYSAIETKVEQSAISQHEDEQSAISQREDEQSAFSQREDEQSAIRQREDEQSAFSQREDEQSAISQREDEQSAISQREDEQSAFRQREDEQSAFSQREDEQSAISQREDKQSAISQRGDDASERTVSEAESLDSDVKRVNRLSSIEDLSHIYENFLAFASAMAERSPKFQEQLYHVYENVTQAFDPRAQNPAHMEGELIEEQPAQKANVENEVGSPSNEMSSEFEKISLREKEQQHGGYKYRYSGICDESELEKLEEVFGEKGRHVIDTLAEDDDENNPEDDLLTRGSLAGETDQVAVTDPSTLEGEFTEVSVLSNENRDHPHGAVVGEILDGVKNLETATSNEQCEEIEEAEVIENDSNCFNVGDSVNASREASALQSDEDVNETATDVVESGTQTPPEGEDAQGSLRDVSNTVRIVPTLAHADHVSTDETGTSSFYLVQEINDQVWEEVEGKRMSEPVIKTSVQVSTTAESATDRESSTSVVTESAVDEEDEGITGDIEVQEPTVAGFYDGYRDDCTIPRDDESFSKPDISNINQTCFVAVEDANVKTADDNSGGEGAVLVDKYYEGQFNDSETKDLRNVTASGESQELREDAGFLEEEDLVIQDASPTEQSSLRLDICADDNEVQVSDPNQTSNNNCPKCGAIPNVCTAASFETSVPLVSACSREVEVHYEQTVLSAVCASEHAQVWEGAVTRVDESVSLTTQDFARETETLQESLSPEFDNIECPSAGDNPDVISSEICNTTKEEETVLTADIDKPQLCNLSSQTDVQDSNPETGISEAVTKNLESSLRESSQGEEKPVDSSEYAEKFESPEEYSLGTSHCSDSLIVNSSLVDDPEKNPEQNTECLSKSSSDEEYGTPEGTLELSEDNNKDAERDVATRGNRELNFEKGETNSAEPVDVLRLEKEDKTTSTSEERDDSVTECDPAAEPESDSENSQSDALDRWSNSSNLEERPDLSEMDILKAMTAAFEEILELHGEDSDTDDTRL